MVVWMVAQWVYHLVEYSVENLVAWLVEKMVAMMVVHSVVRMVARSADCLDTSKVVLLVASKAEQSADYLVEWLARCWVGHWVEY